MYDDIRKACGPTERKTALIKAKRLYNVYGQIIPNAKIERSTTQTYTPLGAD